MLAEKVVQFENENMKVYNHIQSYFKSLNDKGRDYAEKDTTKTQQAYEADIRLYYHLLKGKPKKAELEYLTFDDLNISEDNFEEYIEILCDLKDENGNNKYVNKTINRKTIALKSFVKFLRKKKIIDIDISYLQSIDGKKERRNHYGVLTTEETLKLAELALQERDKGEIKRALILTAFKTGLRLGELLNLKFSDFIRKGEDIYIRGIGKGNKEFEIKINKDLYDDLQILNKGQEKIFSLSSRRISDMMDRLRTKMGIQPERQIVFHSIRKAFGTMVWVTSDIENARRALRHSSILTTQLYLGESNFEVNESIFSIEKIDGDLFKNVNHEELLQAITALPKNTQMIINMKLTEILKQNK